MLNIALYIITMHALSEHGFFLLVSLCATSYATLEYLEPHPGMWFSPPTTLGKMPSLRSEDHCLANGWSVVLGITLSSNSHHINTVGFPQQTFNYSCKAIYSNASQ